MPAFSYVPALMLVASLCAASPGLARTSAAPPGLQPHAAETAWLTPGTTRRGLETAPLPVFRTNQKGLIDFTGPPRFPLEISRSGMVNADGAAIETVPLPASMLLLGVLVVLLAGKRRPARGAPVSVRLRRL